MVLVLLLLVTVVLMWGSMHTSQTTTTKIKSSRPRMDILAVLETLLRQTAILLTRPATTQAIICTHRHIRVHR